MKLNKPPTIRKNFKFNIWSTKNKSLDFMLDTITFLLFVFIILVIIKGIITFLFPPTTPELDLSVMLIPYAGLPLVFWIFLSIGLCLGFTFNGFMTFKTISESDSHNITHNNSADSMTFMGDIKKKR